MSEIYGKIGNATKWSALTEVISKLVNPITSMVLARLLTPSAFGAVATITMIITFTEIFTDAGFQKYIAIKIQNIVLSTKLDQNATFTDLYLSSSSLNSC